MTPPRLPLWLLDRLLPEEVAEAVVGDLAEQYDRDTSAGHPAVRRHLAFWWRALRALAPISVQDAGRALPPIGLRREGGIFPNLNSDIRQAWRQLIATPRFTATAVGLLALGIAGNALLYAIVDSQVTNPVPGTFRSPELVRYSIPTVHTPGTEPTYQTYSDADLRGIAARSEQVALVAGSADVTAMVDVGEVLSRQRFSLVSADWLAVMRPMLHLSGPTTMGTLHANQVLVTYSWWQRHLHSDPLAVGRRIAINGHSFVIAGVLAREFRSATLVASADALPLFRAGAALPPAGYQTVVGRLKPGVTPPPPVRNVFHVDSAGRVVADQTTPGWRSMGMGRDLLTREYAPVHLLSSLLLVIASVNVALLLLGRGITRRRTIGIRLALGASRARVVRLLLVESALIGFMACGAASALAAGICGLLVDVQRIPLGGATISWRSLLLSGVVATGAALLLGVIPSLHATRIPPGTVIKSGTSGGGIGRSRLQRAFVVIEVALSMGLACAALLLLGAGYRMVGGAGYEKPRRTLVTTLTPDSLPGGVARRDFSRRLRNEVAAIPGVASVALTGSLPFLGERSDLIGLPVRGQVRADSRVVGSGYFQAAGIRVLEGQDITDADATSERPRVWVDQSVAQATWPEGTAVGRPLEVQRLFYYPYPSHTIDTTIIHATVAGVVGSVPSGDRFDRFALYWSLEADSARLTRDDLLALLVRVREGSALPPGAVENAIRRVDRSLAFEPARTLQYHIDQVMDFAYMVGLMALVSSGFALLMACAGLYAAIAFGIGQRRREIGIRLALGATSRQVIMHFFTEGSLLAMVGFMLGVPVTIAVIALQGDRDVSTVLLGRGMLPPVVALLLGVIALASWLPARRAATVDPMEAVRSE